MSQQLVERGKDTPVSALQKLLTANQKQLAMALPNSLRERPDRFIRLATTALITTPSLQNCNMLSIANSVMLAAQLGLEPNNGLGHGWLIPYKGVCTFQPGYRGLLELAYRSESIVTAQPIVVYVGDDFDYAEGAEPRLIHRPAPIAQRRSAKDEVEEWEWVGAYSRVKLPSGHTDVLWMWRDEILAVRDKSGNISQKNPDASPWRRWFWEMAKKTPVKRHCKFLRLSGAAQLAVGVDDQAEAFAGRPSTDKLPDIAQDLVIDEYMKEQALSADDALEGSREAAQEVAERKLSEMGKR